MKVLRAWGVVLFWCWRSQGLLFAETQAFFSSQESVENVLVQHIDRSHLSIDMALFEFRSPALRHALTRAIARGVSIRVVLDASRPRESHASEIPARWLGGKHMGGRGVMHNKFVLFDRACVVSGSYNWTPGAEYANYENILVVDDPAVVESFEKEFNTLWERAAIRPTLSREWGKPHASRRKKTRPKSTLRKERTQIISVKRKKQREKRNFKHPTQRFNF